MCRPQIDKNSLRQVGFETKRCKKLNSGLSRSAEINLARIARKATTEEVDRKIWVFKFGALCKNHIQKDTKIQTFCVTERANRRMVREDMDSRCNWIIESGDRCSSRSEKEIERR